VHLSFPDDHLELLLSPSVSGFLRSIRPVGTDAEAGRCPFHPHIDISSEEERQAPVELAKISPAKVGKNVVGRIVETAGVRCLQFSRVIHCFLPAKKYPHRKHLSQRLLFFCPWYATCDPYSFTHLSPPSRSTKRGARDDPEGGSSRAQGKARLFLSSLPVDLLAAYYALFRFGVFLL